MAKRDENSLSDEATRLADARRSEPEDRSLGDQSTFAGADDSSASDLGNASGIAEIDMEVVDLSARYTIEKTLGKGGMGKVLLATDTRLRRKVAIKRVLGDIAKNPMAIHRFLTEARSIAALNHPNIIEVYDYGRDKDGPFLIMEYVEGGSLLDRCRQGPLSLEEAVNLTCQLCDGLGLAHEAGIIHRDIKPANILVTRSGLPKLTDFGLAHEDAGDNGMTVAGAVLGTLDFMPPEQRRDATSTDARSDLWSLAATLYQMVTGKSPKVIRLHSLPLSLREVVSKALEDDQAERYQSASEFRDALRGCLHKNFPPLSELGHGQCLSCGAPNDSNRKYCRECAVSLRVNCLACEVEIPVWEKVCGECGAKQAELAEQRRAAMESRKEEAERLLNQHEYEQATAVARELLAESDPRFQQLRTWAEQFPEKAKQQREQVVQHSTTLLQEALQHEESYDYRSGVQSLVQVPKFLCKEKLPGCHFAPETALARLESKHNESQRLKKLIHEKVKAGQPDGLLPEVETLLKLKPNKPSMVKLKQRLIERERVRIEARDTTFAEARGLFAQGNYGRCLSELVKIDESLMTPEIRALRAEARINQSFAGANDLFDAQNYQGCLTELGKIESSRTTPRIRELSAKASANQKRMEDLKEIINDAFLDNELDGLRSKINEFSSLKRHDPWILSVRQRFNTLAEESDRRLDRCSRPQEEKARSDGEHSEESQPLTLARVRRLRSECRFRDALFALEQLQHLHDPEHQHLRRECEFLEGLKAKTVAAISSAHEFKWRSWGFLRRFNDAVRQACVYRDELDKRQLKDTQTEAQYEQFRSHECKLQPKNWNVVTLVSILALMLISPDLSWRMLWLFGIVTCIRSVRSNSKPKLIRKELAEWFLALNIGGVILAFLFFVISIVLQNPDSDKGFQASKNQIPILVERLTDEAFDYDEVVSELREIGPDAIPQLVQLLAEDEESLTAEAAYRAAEIHYVIGLLQIAAGHPEKAAVEWQASVNLNPSLQSGCWPSLAALKSELGDGSIDQAIQLYEAAQHYAAAGEYDAAEKLYRKSMEVAPKFPWSYNNLAWEMATCPVPARRNGAAAVVLAKEAAQLTGNRYYAILDTLAAAHAEAGDYSSAVQVAEKAVRLAPKSESDQFQFYVDRYRSEKPWCEYEADQRKGVEPVAASTSGAAQDEHEADVTEK